MTRVSVVSTTNPIMPTQASQPRGAVKTPAGFAPAGQIRELQEQINRALAEYVEGQAREYAERRVFASLCHDVTEFVCRPGKRLRPLLFLLGHRVFGRAAGGAGQAVSEAALLKVAVSLELLHAFILVHDDIIDRAETRRGLPTLHRVIEGRFAAFTDRHRAGRNLALVMGDILFALAQNCLARAGLPPELAVRLGARLLDCMVETGFGEAADIIHSTRDVAKVSAADIEHMYCLKTTCYTVEGPLVMAAILSGADDATLEAIGRVARPAGLAFQIQNDLQEFARFEVSDAEVPADILEGKKTLLMRTAYERLSESDRGLLQLCFGSGQPTEGTVSKARELVVKSGAVGVLSERMDQLFAASQQETRWPGFAPETQRDLAALLQLVRGMASPS